MFPVVPPAPLISSSFGVLINLPGAISGSIFSGNAVICPLRAAEYIRGDLIHLLALLILIVHFSGNSDPKEELTSQKKPRGGEGGFEVFSSKR